MSLEANRFGLIEAQWKILLVSAIAKWFLKLILIPIKIRADDGGALSRTWLLDTPRRLFPAQGSIGRVSSVFMQQTQNRCSPAVPPKSTDQPITFLLHSDRTSKSYPPTTLTPLGYQQIYQSGEFYHSCQWQHPNPRHQHPSRQELPTFSSDSHRQVLQNSATGFLQGLYPPVGATLGSQSLANGSSIEAPFDGYQLIPVSVLATATDTFKNAYAIRAISGMTLAAQIIQQLNATLNSATNNPLLSIQFGEYASFLSFFGLAAPPSASVNCTRITAFASSMAFELVTNATITPSSSRESTDPLPFFRTTSPGLPWPTFLSEMQIFAIGNQTAWCATGGNGSTACTTSSSTSPSSSSSLTPTGSGKGGIGPVAGGVIGAMVMLAVILGVEAVVLLIAGLRVMRERGGDGGMALGGLSSGGKA
ncbi:uncharacterized protein PAC_13206 [Phialocephala subalpina]|uniref:Uncharacterized protein n=1 Tax=Phialocephala subalpina TaxID=576137 RepID=A0A1L7XE39_9HELO|nr:uncharacterized protein PAC_13206 [Phialocephala subalpina]